MSILRQTKWLIAVSLLVFSVSSIWSVTLWASESTGDAPDAAEKVNSGVLDGMTFSGELGPKGQPADVKDTFVFKDGKFISLECEKNCNYPARPYFIRKVGNTIEFISETRCRDKDAKIVWRGIVDGETIKGGFHWTSHRWYWTVEKDFQFEGKLIKGTTPIIGSQ